MPLCGKFLPSLVSLKLVNRRNQRTRYRLGKALLPVTERRLGSRIQPDFRYQRKPVHFNVTRQRKLHDLVIGNAENNAIAVVKNFPAERQRKEIRKTIIGV